MTSAVNLTWDARVGADGTLKFDGDGSNARLRDDLDIAAGAACWVPGHEREHAALAFACPCGCRTWHCISIRPGGRQGHSWEWDGDVDRPTLKPSVQATTPCRCHGYLTAGVWTPC